MLDQEWWSTYIQTNNHLDIYICNPKHLILWSFPVFWSTKSKIGKKWSWLPTEVALIYCSVMRSRVWVILIVKSVIPIFSPFFLFLFLNSVSCNSDWPHPQRIVRNDLKYLVFPNLPLKNRGLQACTFNSRLK